MLLPSSLSYWQPLICSLYLRVCFFFVIFTIFTFYILHIKYVQYLSFLWLISLNNTLQAHPCCKWHIFILSYVWIVFHCIRIYIYMYIYIHTHIQDVIYIYSHTHKCLCSVAKLHLTLCNLMNCSTPGFSVLHYLLEFAQIHVYWVSEANLLISSSATPSSFCLQSFPPSESFLMSRLFVTRGQSIGASASVSVLPMNIKDWYPLGLTGLIP